MGSRFPSTTARDVPPTPEWAKPVPPPVHQPGDDWQVIAKRERARGDTNADIITCLVAWQDSVVRASYALGRPLAEADAKAAKRCADIAGPPRSSAKPMILKPGG